MSGIWTYVSYTDSSERCLSHENVAAARRWAEEESEWEKTRFVTVYQDGKVIETFQGFFN